MYMHKNSAGPVQKSFHIYIEIFSYFHIYLTAYQRLDKKNDVNINMFYVSP